MMIYILTDEIICELHPMNYIQLLGRMDPSPKNNRGASHPGPVKLEVPKRYRPSAISTLLW